MRYFIIFFVVKKFLGEFQSSMEWEDERYPSRQQVENDIIESYEGVSVQITGITELNASDYESWTSPDPEERFVGI